MSGFDYNALYGLHGKALAEICHLGQIHNQDSLDKKLSEIIHHACDHLNSGGRKGEISLFRRDPFKDRIVLSNSTVEELNPGKSPSKEHFTELNQNYDGTEKVCYIDLNDVLVRDGHARNDMFCRKTRGITGFVCIACCPLMLIGASPDSVIESQCEKVTNIKVSIAKYGFPLRGCNISESTYQLARSAKQQYIGVPIFSNTAQGSIGVLRYVADLNQPHLNTYDLGFLAEVAKIIASTIRAFRFIRNLKRQIEFNPAVKHFQTTGDFSDFLKYIAHSLSSKIASVYVVFSLEGRQTLRLLNAWGISDSVSTLRHQGELHDYHDNTKGLTWKLFKMNMDEQPHVTVVSQDPHWQGLNMNAFYRGVLASKGVSMGSNSDEDKAALTKQYSIRLMGSQLKQGSETPTGVLKVEFPAVYDNADFYNDEDKEFFKQCCNVMTTEVPLLKSFLDLSWFNNNPHHTEQFILLFSNVIVYALVDPTEKPEFWGKIEVFIRQQHKREFVFQLQETCIIRMKKDCIPLQHIVDQEQFFRRMPEPVARIFREYHVRQTPNPDARKKPEQSNPMNPKSATGNNHIVVKGNQNVNVNINQQFDQRIELRPLKEAIQGISNLPPDEKEIGMAILDEVGQGGDPKSISLAERAKKWVEKNEGFLGATAGIFRKLFESGS